VPHEQIVIAMGADSIAALSAFDDLIPHTATVPATANACPGLRSRVPA